jgi:two-component system response regulator FixJ
MLEASSMADSDRTIYLIDDDEAVRRSAGFMLKSAGYAVKSYESGIPFLKEVKGLDPGCIVLDVRMPGLDGIEVQHELRSRGIDYPVIVMTGHGDITVAVRAMKAGAIDFIEKPFEKAVLLRTIEEAFASLRNRNRTRARSEEAMVRLEALTPREKDVLHGLAQGLPNKTIAYDLGISPRTIEIHRANLMTKLGLSSLSEALRLAFAAGMGEDGK